MKRLILTILLSVLVGACATTPQKIDLPKDEEDYSLCKQDLLSKYPDIKKYENPLRFGFSKKAPELFDIKKSLGKPSGSRFSWWNSSGFIFGGLLFSPAGPGSIVIGAALLGTASTVLQPVLVKNWKKGNYDIDVITIHSYHELYQGRLYYFSWSEINKKDCKT